MHTIISVTLFLNFRDNSRALLTITPLLESDKFQNLRNNSLSSSLKSVNHFQFQTVALSFFLFFHSQLHVFALFGIN